MSPAWDLYHVDILSANYGMVSTADADGHLNPYLKDLLE